MVYKTCPKCGQTLSTLLFARDKNRKDGFNCYCKECCKKRNRKYYKDNIKKLRKKNVERNLKTRNKNRKKVLEYLKSHPCKDCDEPDPVVLQFDHLREKKNTISRMLLNSYSWKRIIEEIKKCDVVCANCHFRRTAKRSDTWYKSK